VKKRKKWHDGELLELHELAQPEHEDCKTGVGRHGARRRAAVRCCKSGQPGLPGLTPGWVHGYGRVRHQVWLLGWQWPAGSR
jgi:hypothetical protein